MRSPASIFAQLFQRRNNLHRNSKKSQTVRLELELLENRVVPTGNASAIIQGTAFIDANGNGMFDPDEGVLSGAATSLIGTTTTGTEINEVAVSDENGVFQFLNVLPGTYQLEKDPSFYRFAEDNSGDLLEVEGGQTIVVNTAYLGLTPDLISMRQFLTTTTPSELFAAPGEGETPVNFRENNLPFLAVPQEDLIVGKNNSAVFDLSGFFSDPDFTNSLVRFDTSFGPINVELFDTQAPKNVANFFNYVTSDRYDDTIFHRLDADFVLQGGGHFFDADASALEAIDRDLPVENEFGQSNTFGTIAMAKIEDEPDSATSEFFFNLADNSDDLDTQNDGFTVFGEIEGEVDAAVLSIISQLTVHNFGSPFDEIPLDNYNGTLFPVDATTDNFVVIQDVAIVRRDEFLSYSLVSNSNPDVLTATIEQNRLLIDPVNDEVGQADITILTEDRFGAAVETTFTISVENQPPTAEATLSSERPLEDEVLSVEVTVEDPNGDPVSVSYTWKVNGVIQRETGFTTDLSDTFDLTGLAAPGDVITLEVVPTDFDDSGETGETVVLEVTVDEAPETTGIDDASFTGPGEFTLDVGNSFSDPDEDALTFTATLDDLSPLPNWLTISSSGVFSGNPGVDDEGDFTIIVTAADPFGLSVSSTFTLSVSNTPTSLNDDPVIAEVVVTPDPPGSTDVLFAEAVASDDDDDTLSFTFEWFINDALEQTTADTTNFVDSLDLTGIANTGDVIRVEVTANDGTVDSQIVSSSVTVA